MKETFETFYLLAAVQGLLLCIVLFTKKENNSANRILAAAILALSLELTAVIYYSKGLYLQFPHLFGITYPFPFLYGPLFYIYAQIVSKKEKEFKLRDLIHFYPVFLIYSFTFPIYLYSGAQKIWFVENMKHTSGAIFFTVIEMLMPVQGIIYTILTIKAVADYNKKIRDTFSNIDLINLNWLKYLTFGLIVIWLIVAILAVLSEIFNVNGEIYFALNTALSVLIYSIGYMGLKQPEIFLSSSGPFYESRQQEKYKRSGLGEEIAEAIKDKLERGMEGEKLYLDNNLTLQKLAEKLNVSSHNLSEVINSRLNLSYYDYINSHRVEEFISRIKDPENEKYNLLSIAFESGRKTGRDGESTGRAAASMPLAPEAPRGVERGSGAWGSVMRCFVSTAGPAG